MGIESSCDETALALVRDGKCIGQTLSSQVDVHALFGGVVPEIASREHGRAIAPLYDLLMRRCGVEPQDMDCIAVARGPGLLGSLLVGVAFAKGLALSSGKPLIGVNHLHAHILAAGLEEKISFPALALLVSGGHTHIYLVRSPLSFTLLGRSIDDAAGEALDKFGKMIGLPYPAGKYIDFFGASGQVVPNLFPYPYLDNDNLDFSFSGLKTAALNLLGKRTDLRFTLQDGNAASLAPVLPDGEAGKELASLCASYTNNIAVTLTEKMRRAIGHVGRGGINSVILAGGVAANSTVRGQLRVLCAEFELPFIVPAPALCTDNAAMIAYTGYLLRQRGLSHELDFAAIPRGQQVPDDYRLNLS